MTSPSPHAAADLANVSGARTRRILWSIVVACCVFGGFTAYAYLAPATFQAITEIRLEVPPPAPPLHPIADTRQRLEDSVRSAASLKALAAQLGSSTPDARLELARRLTTRTTMTTTDGRTFQITCLHSTAAGAQALCKALGQLGAVKLPEAALRRDPLEEHARKKKVEELLDFLAKHPELSSAQGDGRNATVKTATVADPLLNTLLHQRRVALAELADLQRVDPKNPYSDGLTQEVALAKQRLAAIDAAISKRQSGLKPQAEQGVALDNQVLQQLTKRIDSLALVGDTLPPPTVALKATVTRQAALPGAPVIPDRTRLMILGGLAALGVTLIGLGLAFAARPRTQTQTPAPGQAPVFEPAAHVEPAAAQYPVASYLVDPSDEQAFDPIGEGLAYGVTQAAPREPELQASRTLVLEEPDRGRPDADRPNADRPNANPDRAAIDRARAAANRASETDKAKDERSPRTQLGGFASAPPPPEAPSRPGNPISVKTVVALEAEVDAFDAFDAAEEAAPHTLLGGAEPPKQPSVNASERKSSYSPPKRNITRRLGSLSWLDQAELQQQAAPNPVSTRYSYVSSRPPPPDAAEPDDPAVAPKPEVIDAYAEPANPREVTTALVVHSPQQLPMQRHPAAAGWHLDPTLLAVTGHDLVNTVLANSQNGGCVVGVTSRSELSAAKARIAASLAFRLGELQQPRVLLMEGDFQNPMVHRTARVEMPMAGGFSQQLQQRLRAPNARVPWEVVECQKTVDVMAEGFIRSPGAILSQQFEECLNELRRIYDVIIIDGPPASTASECRALADVIDGVVICTQPSRPDVQTLANSLFQNKRFVIGCTSG